MDQTSVKRAKLLIAMVALLTLCGLNAAVQAVFVLIGFWNDDTVLPYIQAVIAVIAFAGAIGAWKLRPWAAWAAVAYGVVTGAMVLSLPRFVEMPDAALNGLKFSAALIVLIGAAMAWGIRVGIRRTQAT
jgi:predicted membrane-bound spermidine synthase